VSLLKDFVTWPPARLEQLESLEQLRALAQGARIHVADAVAAVPPGVDTPADLEHVRALISGQP
jgi:3-deoxy-manno-octulosonate cytidylyltransferase (CMP-KDO synthetase)